MNEQSNDSERLRDRFVEIEDAIAEVAVGMAKIKGPPGDKACFDYVEDSGDGAPNLVVKMLDSWRGQDESYFLVVPWSCVEAQLEGQDWRSAYQERVEKERAAEEAAKAQRAAEADAREEERERAEYERLAAKYGDS